MTPADVPPHAATAMMTDFHSHYLTERYVAEARDSGHRYPDGMPQWPTWSVADHLDLMNRCGIGRSLLSISSPGVHFGDDAVARELARHVNEFGAGVAHANPQRFGHFAVLPLPDIAGSIAEMRYGLDELGSEGVTVLSNAEGIYLGAEQLHPLLTELNERRAIVFVHPASPPCADRVSLGRPHPMIEFIFDTTRTVSDLVLSGTLARYPDIRWIFSHGAGTLPSLADRIELFRRTILGDEREHPSVQEQVSHLWFDSAGTPFPHQIPATVAAFGSQRLLYGSDYCWTAASGVVAQVATIDDAPRFANQTWRELTSANAALLLAERGQK